MSDDWIIYEATRTGKTLEEVRAEMRRRGSKTDPKKRGLASNPEAARKANQIRWAKYYAENPEKRGNGKGAY